ncbi:MAG: UDP-N-acetylmuramoyl-L-alanyl-D-glutamate--2,6-diaminopimelate ligase [Planctomycetaceae bacterium]|nr:MAG: UDP-N-acetylmuramoyl-L-alanyl-D-glutamate--2,6-diaminopimelate ligase [Planctomycetaceae bacterium]
MARRGQRADGHTYINEAIARGAVGLIVETPHAGCPVPQGIVPHADIAWARLCQALWGYPDRQLRLYGVTGTDGKTTTTWWWRHLLRTQNRCGLIGTIEYHDGTVGTPAAWTTPPPDVLFAWMHRMVQQRTHQAVLELSSHALAQQRAAELTLSAAIVTNITRDHLDYHGTWAAYREAKARIIELLHPQGVLVLNRDDAGSWSLRELARGSQHVVSFSLHQPAEYHAQLLEVSWRGMTIRIRRTLGKSPQAAVLKLPVVGRHNVENACAVIAASCELGAELAWVCEQLQSAQLPPGRLERIALGQPFEVMVDYAHTPAALKRCLHSLRELTAGRLWCVLGAGGQRDRAKRPLLGEAARLADRVILTSDNPRGEDAASIAQEILAGLGESVGQVAIELDRAAAIRHAVWSASAGDCVLIAGKGHERTQDWGDRVTVFDDRAVARFWLQRRGGVSAPRSFSKPRQATRLAELWNR